MKRLVAHDGAGRPRMWRRHPLSWLVASAGMAVALAFAAPASKTVEMPRDPILSIETGMHTAAITGVSTDVAGRYAVTAGFDKTARVWDLTTGRQLHVLRPPQSAAFSGMEGRLLAVAISPNGAVAAVGGLTGFGLHGDGTTSLYLFDLHGGRMIGRLPTAGLTRSLDFSRNGLWLAVAVEGTNSDGGVLLWSTNRRVPPSYEIYGAACTKVIFSPDSRILYTLGEDAKVRAYRIDGDKLVRFAEVRPPGGRHLTDIALSPEGNLLAASFRDTPSVVLLDGRTLALKSTLSGRAGQGGSFASLAWTSDGQGVTLNAAGWIGSESHRVMRRWSSRPGVTMPELALDVGLVTAMQPLPRGAMLVSGSANFGIVDAAGHWRGFSPSAALDFEGMADGLRIADDARRVQFAGRQEASGVLQFDLRERRLVHGGDPRLMPARTTGLPVTQWRNEMDPRLNGKLVDPADADNGDFNRALAIAPDAGSFVLGRTLTETVYSPAGSKRWSNFEPLVWGLNISLDGQLLVSALGDGTIRWNRMSDGKELLSLFVHSDGRRWVLWTPSGYYDASPGAEDLIGWHVNRGADEGGDFFPASRFRALYYRPDIIDGVLDAMDESKAITLADGARGGGSAPRAPARLTQVLPPVIELESPSDVRTDQPQLTLRYRARSPADAPVTRVFARVDGQLLSTARNFAVEAVDGVRELRVDVPARNSRVQLFAENRNGVSAPATIQVSRGGEAARSAAQPAQGVDAPATQPRLFVVAVGVGRYANPVIPKLSYAAKDASDFAAALMRQKGRLYSSVEVRLLTEEKATKDDIMDALDWLQHQVGKDDYGMLFLSGHGVQDSSMGYLYLPVNADPDKLKRTAVSLADIRTTLAGVPGRALAFLDTCHSGSVFGNGRSAVMVDVKAVVNDLASPENGVVVFSSSSGRQYSLEDSRWNNGAFTKALVEGLDGKADESHSGYVTLKRLDVYITERVSALTDGRQNPVSLAPVMDYQLARLK